MSIIISKGYSCKEKKKTISFNALFLKSFLFSPFPVLILSFFINSIKHFSKRITQHMHTNIQLIIMSTFLSKQIDLRHKFI